MARLRNFLHSLASSYVALGANVVYTFLSVPLALHYLSKPEFGLWALTTQLAGYMALIDFGMSGAVARLLIDHKDQKDGGAYGGLVQTAFLVGLVQGGLILLAGLALGLGLRWVPNVPPELRSDFRWLVLGQAGLLAAMFATRIFANILWAHQRQDVTNYAQSVLFALNFGVLWLGFATGAGVFSLLWAQLAGWAGAALVQWVGCARLRLFPSPGRWGRPSRARFHEAFAYGKDVFLFALGSQMINASQTLLVTPVLGLDAAAVWSVCTRTYLVVCQVVWKIFDAASTGLSEMYVRAEHERFFRRFRSVTVLTASVAVLAAVLFAACNQAFVRLWTSGRIGWWAGNDVLLAGWSVLMALQRCHVGLLGVKKDLRVVKYVYFLEGLVFLGLASLVTRSWGFPGLIASSLVATAACSFSYGLHRTCRDFKLSRREMAVGWLGPAARLAALMAVLALVAWLGAARLPGLLALAALLATLGATGAWLFLRYGLDADLQQEAARRGPAWLGPALGLRRKDAAA
jgi:O-antigen/teichoic acid export membrane protein